MRVGSAPGRKRFRPSAEKDPVILLRRYAIKLFDKNDGRAVDWPKVAETAFRVAFSCLDEIPGDDRGRSVVRRAHEGAYNRLVGTQDSVTPYVLEVPAKPPFAPDSHPPLHSGP